MLETCSPEALWLTNVLLGAVLTALDHTSYSMQSMSCLLLSSRHVIISAACARVPQLHLQAFLEAAVRRNSGALHALKEALADRLEKMPMLRPDAKVIRLQGMLGQRLSAMMSMPALGVKTFDLSMDANQERDALCLVRAG